MAKILSELPSSASRMLLAAIPDPRAFTPVVTLDAAPFFRFGDASNF